MSPYNASHPAEYIKALLNGTTVPLELGFEEDVEKELHHFIKLSRMGNYSEAQAFFNYTLRKYNKFFPAIAEYAGMLLEQGRYGRAAEFLSNHLAVVSEDLQINEIQLLRLMKSLAEAYSKGALRSALVEAQQAWELLALQNERVSDELYDEVQTSEPWPALPLENGHGIADFKQVHIFEVYVNIIILRYQSSQWVNEHWMRCPFSRPTIQTRNSFVHWYCTLRDHGLLWEASRILRALLPIISTLPADDARELLYNSLSRPSELPVPDIWALLMIALHQAHYLLNSVLLSRILGADNSAADKICEEVRDRLEAAGQTWNMLLHDEDTVPLHLPLTLERISLEIVEAALSSQPADSDSISALSSLLLDADIRHDLRNQVLARIYILVVNYEVIEDWRDLYSIFELQMVDSGNIVDYAHTWELLAAWTIGRRLPF